MKALVTGGTGFIGGALAGALDAAGWEVHLLVRPESRDKLPPVPDWRIHLADIANPQADLQSAVQGMEVVFHAAAVRDRWGAGWQTYQQTNVEGTQRLLQAARDRAGRFVYLSSVGVHGYPGVLGIDEDFPLRPGDGKREYHSAKAQGEQLVFATLAGSDTQGVIVRPTITYGPGDKDGMVTRLLALLAQGRFVRIGPGKNHLHLTYIDDLISGLFLAGIHPLAAGDTFIFAGPRSIAFSSLVAQCQQALRVGAAIRREWLGRLWLPEGFSRLAAAILEKSTSALNRSNPPPITRDQIDTICIHRGFSFAKAASQLGYQPQVTEPAGLERTVSWMIEQGLLPPARIPSSPASIHSEKAW